MGRGRGGGQGGAGRGGRKIKTLKSLIYIRSEV